MVKPDKETLDAWHADPDNWKLGLFYYNPKDKRVLPPKLIKWMGWTINFANPFSILVLVGIILFVFFIDTYFK
jgi:uncharacterized membrane protein